MLSPGASNALLKTLEEPPPHVVFVLATTDPHKVLATIRSRTQHFEFHLLPADVLAEHVRWVIDDAGLDVAPEVVDHVVRQGGGSARDTLSALDQVVAAGGVVPDGSHIEELVEAICDADAGPRHQGGGRRDGRRPRPAHAGRGAARPAARGVPRPHGRAARPGDRGATATGPRPGPSGSATGPSPGRWRRSAGAARDAPGPRAAHRRSRSRSCTSPGPRRPPTSTRCSARIERLEQALAGGAARPRRPHRAAAPRRPATRPPPPPRPKRPSGRGGAPPAARRRPRAGGSKPAPPRPAPPPPDPSRRRRRPRPPAAAARDGRPRSRRAHPGLGRRRAAPAQAA